MSLIVLNVFLAVTAIAGGVALITGAAAPSVDMLQGSPFDTYFVPGLALVILVGGLATVALFMLLRRHRYAALASLAAAVAIVVFESVEIAVIGSPQGSSRILQIFYFAVGGFIGIMAAIAFRDRART